MYLNYLRGIQKFNKVENLFYPRFTKWAVLRDFSHVYSISPNVNCIDFLKIYFEYIYYTEHSLYCVDEYVFEYMNAFSNNNVGVIQ